MIFRITIKTIFTLRVILLQINANNTKNFLKSDKLLGKFKDLKYLFRIVWIKFIKRRLATKNLHKIIGLILLDIMLKNSL